MHPPDCPLPKPTQRPRANEGEDEGAGARRGGKWFRLAACHYLARRRYGYANRALKEVINIPIQSFFYDCVRDSQFFSPAIARTVRPIASAIRTGTALPI